MTKKLFLLALFFIIVSLGYYFYSENKNNVPEVGEQAPKQITSTSTIIGVYTGMVSGDECKTILSTIELLDKNEVFITNEPKNCKATTTENIEGVWQETIDSVIINNKEGKNLMEFGKAGDELVQKNAPSTFKKTVFKNYISEYKNITAEYGSYGVQEFVRLWAPNGVLLTTLIKASTSNKFSNKMYSWENRQKDTILTSSTTEEIFVEE